MIMSSKTLRDSSLTEQGANMAPLQQRVVAWGARQVLSKGLDKIKHVVGIGIKGCRLCEQETTGLVIE